MSYSPKLFQKHLVDSQIALLGRNVHGSQTILPYGWEIRKRLYNIGIQLLKEQGFLEVALSDLVSPRDLALVNSIIPISKNYPYVDVGDFHMAAGHEISAYLFAREYLKHFPHTILPFNFFQIGSVYRYPRNTKFPFNYGERKSFLECYSIHASSAAARDFLLTGYKWNRKIIQETLRLPSIEVERPLITNKPISRKTVCIDSLTPLGATVITGMTYFHDDIFTRLLAVKRKDLVTRKNQLVFSVHFGVSDNIFFSYLLNAHDTKGFRLLSRLAPCQVSIIYGTDCSEVKKTTERIARFSRIKDIRYEVRFVESKRIKQAIDQDMLRGIPVTILISSSNEDRVDVKIVNRTNGDYMPLKSLSAIYTLLIKNDESIYKSFLAEERSGIVLCRSMGEVNMIVQSGKVAEVFMDDTSENVVRCEAALHGGEILGFRKTDQRVGEDLLTGHTTSTIAFISRRI